MRRGGFDQKSWSLTKNVAMPLRLCPTEGGSAKGDSKLATASRASHLMPDLTISQHREQARAADDIADQNRQDVMAKGGQD